MPRNDFKKRALYNVIFLGCLGLLTLIIFSTAKEFLKVKKINDEISELHQEIIELENNNLELSELLKYFNSDNFAEKKARTELGLKKEGEQVVIIPKEKNDNQILPKSKSDDKKDSSKSNFKKWWDYFFNKN
jgi:cell division protein FtsB